MLCQICDYITTLSKKIIYITNYVNISICLIKATALTQLAVRNDCCNATRRLYTSVSKREVFMQTMNSRTTHSVHYTCTQIIKTTFYKCVNQMCLKIYHERQEQLMPPVLSSPFLSTFHEPTVQCRQSVLSTSGNTP